MVIRLLLPDAVMIANEILTVEQMYAADRAAIQYGVPSTSLMEQAGLAVAQAVMALTDGGLASVLILCGPGNNGGDGFVAARHLASQGFGVIVGQVGLASALSGDAAWAADQWDGPTATASTQLLEGADIIVDAIFGAGLNRPLDATLSALVTAINQCGARVVAVDVPTGVSGNDGSVLGNAIRADVTVSFFRPKPAHYLYPARAHIGRLIIADIGIPQTVLAAIDPTMALNGPALWRSRFPRPAIEGHKYRRGHALILGGSLMTGAARLATRAAMRVGAGLVSVACETSAHLLYSLALPGALIHPLSEEGAFAALLADTRRNAVLLGPGSGVGPVLHDAVLEALRSNRCGVLDADVFSSFAGKLATLRQAGLSSRWVLTPHDGEFTRLFGDIDGSRLDRARHAALESGAIIVLKGPDTLIAGPDGRVVINGHAPPDLATAGSGDVLAGLILGLLAQGMDAFDAACAGVWLHAQTGDLCGRGLIAEDLPEAVPTVLKNNKL